MDQDTDHVKKFPRRACTRGTVDGYACEASAMVFLEEPITCGAHATKEEREANAKLRDAWTNQQMQYEDADPPDDVIISRSREGFIKTTFSYRPDAVKAFSKIAGAKYVRDMSVPSGERYWEFPDHRLIKVVAVAGRYFTEIVYEDGLG